MVPRYVEQAVLNEGSIDMQQVDEEAASDNELYATVLTATMATNQHSNNNVSNTSTTERLFCPLNFDGYLCWPRTPAGTVLSQYCPDFVEGFNTKFLAHKTWVQCQTKAKSS